MANKILQLGNGVFIWPRRGERIFLGDLPPNTGPGGGGNMPIYLTSVDVVDFDVTGKVICLNDKRILYEFGKGFGSISLRGEILIGIKGDDIQGRLSPLISYFNDKRVSANKTPLNISTRRGGKFKFYLTQFQIGDWNPEFGICNFSISGDLVNMTV